MSIAYGSNTIIIKIMDYMLLKYGIENCLLRQTTMSRLIHNVILWFILYIPMYLLCTISGKNKGICICICICIWHEYQVSLFLYIIECDNKGCIFLRSVTYTLSIYQSFILYHSNTAIQTKVEENFVSNSRVAEINHVV